MVMNAETEPPWSKEGRSLFRVSQGVRESLQYLSCNLNFEKEPIVGEGQMLEMEGEMMQGNKRKEQREVQFDWSVVSTR